MQKDHDQGHSHHLDNNHPRSVSQPGLLENGIEKSADNNARFDNLITKTSELNELTAYGVDRQLTYSVIWIIFILAISLISLYVFAN